MNDDLDLLNDVLQWRVLVADDEPDNLTLVSAALSFSGVTVEMTERGAHLLELVDSFLPNIVLLDLAMPGVDGWEVQRRLRARPDLNHVPIIALTALAMPEDADRVKIAGFDGYITKPFRVGALLRDVKKCIEIFVEQQRLAQNPVTVAEPTYERTDQVENHSGG
jgi:CheY-like chemotaxis protein